MAQQFTDFPISSWRGSWTYSGTALIQSRGIYNNTSPITFEGSVTPSNVANKQFYIGVGLLARPTGPFTLNNDVNVTIQSKVSGAPGQMAAGVTTEGSALVKNQGVMNAEVQSTDGIAYGFFANSGSINFRNLPAGVVSATAPSIATGVELNWTDAQQFYNYGTINATSYGATTAHQSTAPYGDGSLATGVLTFINTSVVPTPMWVENDGVVTATASGGAQPFAQVFNNWNNTGPVTFVNNGIVTANSTMGAEGIYFGANGFDLTFRNTGLWITQGDGNATGISVHGIWMENDNMTKNMAVPAYDTFINSGTIAEDASFAVTMPSYSSSGDTFPKATFTNTGTITGNWLGLGWPGDLDFFDSGDLHVTMMWFGSAHHTLHAVISGLPTIDTLMKAAPQGNNILVFNLTGTLQKVNNSPASGTDLSIYHLGSSASDTVSIQVSGKTYSWSGFNIVTGTCIPPVAALPGPEITTANQTSSNVVKLAWRTVAGASSYNVKRAATSTGPYTTIATNVSRTSFTDTTAYSTVDYYYVVSAIVNQKETANSAELSLRHKKITGRTIGTSGSLYNSGNVIANVFDGDLNSFFDGPDADNDWVGVDLGSGAVPVITRIGYAPRNRGGQMVGGVFQGANQADFGDAVTLFTITRPPFAGVIAVAPLQNTNRYRYLRYLGPPGSHSDIAEMQLYQY
jgi:hypothetical protein